MLAASKTSAASTGPRSLWPGFVDDQLSSFYRMSIQLLNGLLQIHASR
jgi:hypothetical protein